MTRALKEIERRYRVVEGIVDYAIIVIDREGIVLDFNAGGEKLFGYSRDEMIGRPRSILFTPEDVAQGVVVEEMREAEREGKAEDRRWHVRKDGTRFFANGIMNPLRNEDGEIDAFVKVLRDDTDRKNVEEALRKTEQSFRALFESAPGLYLVLRPDLTIAAVSNAYAEATMTTREGLLGKHMFDVFPDNPENPDAHAVSNLRASLSTVLASGKPHTMALQPYDIRQPDGQFEERWWSPINSPVIDEQGKVAYIIHRVEDVTGFVRDRLSAKNGVSDSEAFARMSSELFNRGHEIEEANRRLRAAMEQLTKSEERVRFALQEAERAASQLKESEARFRHLADSMTQLAWIARPDGHIHWYNKRWYEYTGTTFEETEGWGWRAVHHPEHVDRVVDFVKDAWQRPEPWELTFPLRSAKGEWRWFLTRAVPVLDAEGNIVQWFGTNTDVHEQKEADLERIRLIEDLEKARVLREGFVSMLTHDLRTPLSVCKMSAQAIARRLGDPESAVTLSARIIDNVNRMDQMIRNLLDASRIRAGQPISLRLERCDLREVLAQTLESLALVYGDRFVLRAPAEIRGDWDAEALRRVAENLVNNAAKYGDPEEKVTVSLSAAGSFARFSVHNFGNPLSEAERERVFQQFGRTRSAEESGKAGWGLGLTLVKGIAEAHGGSVEVASDHRGTTFTVSLPLDSMVATLPH